MTGADLHARIEHDLGYHPPAPGLDGDLVRERMEALRDGSKVLSHLLIDLCPVGRELSLALTAIEQACMYGIATLARYPDRLPAN